MFKKLTRELLKKIETEINEVGYIDDSDDTERFLDIKAFNLLKEELKNENKAFDLVDDLIERVKEEIPEEIKQASYKSNYCYYIKPEGKRKWLEIILMNETGDTYLEEDIEKLMDII